ncbi:hypothetical protein GF337_04045 [candidate division KSB1 bacterium]|nr:hypothetical protein [candidate division KSB1 bacterium]
MPSPYLRSIKDWEIREMVVKYLEVKEMFEKHNKPTKDSEYISFKILKELCDIMFDMKEKHHLIFKKFVDPKKRKFESANKFTPNEGEINFMNNVGLVFHKVMVARELKYILNYYTEDSAGYQETKASLERNLVRIELLFRQGVDILLEMLKSHQDNIHLITFCIENQDFCEKQFNKSLSSLLDIVTEKTDEENVYLRTARYYADSGWFGKARDMCQKSLEINPQNEEAKSLLIELQ